MKNIEINLVGVPPLVPVSSRSIPKSPIRTSEVEIFSNRRLLHLYCCRCSLEFYNRRTPQYLRRLQGCVGGQLARLTLHCWWSHCCQQVASVAAPLSRLHEQLVSVCLGSPLYLWQLHVHMYSLIFPVKENHPASDDKSSTGLLLSPVDTTYSRSTGSALSRLILLRVVRMNARAERITSSSKPVFQ